MESVIFDQAMDGLPAELESFKELFGPSFIRAIKKVLNDCTSRLQQLENVYKPSLDDINKEYDQGMKTYSEVVNVDPKAAEQLQNEGLRRLKNLLDSANLAKDQERKQMEKSCQLKKQDLLRSRMYSVLSVFRGMYKADPDSLQQVTGQLNNFISQLTDGLEQCRGLVEKYGADEVISICDDDAVIEAIEFIKAVLLTLPTQVERGFPDLPIDSEGDDKPFVVDEGSGSGTDVYVTDLPAILMPGPVIVDDLPEDDDDISSGSLEEIEVPTTGSTGSPSSSTGHGSPSGTTGSPSSTAGSPSGTTGSTGSPSSTTGSSSDDPTVFPSEITDGVSTPTIPDDTTTGEVGDTGVDGTDSDMYHGTDGVTDTDADLTMPSTALPVAVKGVTEIIEPARGNSPQADDDKDDDKKEKGLLPLYVALLVCISLLIIVMVIMIVMVIILKKKVIAGRVEDNLSEEDKVSLMKEGYVNPTYQFFDKTSTSQ